MKEAQGPDTTSYRTFSEFFVRPLRNEVCPIDTDPSILVMPADGVISQLGKIGEDRVLQTKGHNYSLEALLVGNYPVADLFRNSTSVTAYLFLRDYHHVHVPCNGILHGMIYIPGDLPSVSHSTAQNVPNLLARNEHVICLFDTEPGPMAQVLAGATAVGNIEMVWVGTITPPHEGVIEHWTRPVEENDDSVALLKGQEMGYFKLGSTVTSLFTPDEMSLVEQLEGSSVTKIDQSLAVSTEILVTSDAGPAPLPTEEIGTEHDASPLVGNKKDQI